MNKLTKYILTSLSLIIFLLSCSDVAEKRREDNVRMAWILALMVVLPKPENGNCAPASEVETLGSGTYTRNVQSGQRYWFDTTIRKLASFTDIYTFQVNEAVGQEIQLYTILCKINSTQNGASNDSGLPGQIENLDIRLHNEDRVELPFFKAESGFGDFTFTIPNG